MDDSDQEEYLPPDPRRNMGEWSGYGGDNHHHTTHPSPQKNKKKSSAALTSLCMLIRDHSGQLARDLIGSGLAANDWVSNNILLMVDQSPESLKQVVLPSIDEKGTR